MIPPFQPLNLMAPIWGSLGFHRCSWRCWWCLGVQDWNLRQIKYDRMWLSLPAWFQIYDRWFVAGCNKHKALDSVWIVTILSFGKYLCSSGNVCWTMLLDFQQCSYIAMFFSNFQVTPEFWGENIRVRGANGKNWEDFGRVGGWTSFKRNHI